MLTGSKSALKVAVVVEWTITPEHISHQSILRRDVEDFHIEEELDRVFFACSLSSKGKYSVWHRDEPDAEDIATSNYTKISKDLKALENKVFTCVAGCLSWVPLTNDPTKPELSKIRSEKQRDKRHFAIVSSTKTDDRIIEFTLLESTFNDQSKISIETTDTHEVLISGGGHPNSHIPVGGEQPTSVAVHCGNDERA